MSSGSRGERKDVFRGYSKENPTDLISIIKTEEDQNNFVASHARWDDPNTKNLTMWMYYLKKVENGSSIIKSRLEKNKNEITSLRALQDLTESDEHDTICQEHQDLAKNNPDNPDFYYLSTRCIEDESIKNKAYVVGFEKWKNHDWLAYASSYIYSERGNYEKAYNAFNIVSNNNENLQGIIADTAERVKRILNSSTKNNYKTIVSNEDIDFYNSLESGDYDGGKENPMHVYFLLNQGKIEEAYSLSLNFEDSSNYMQYIIGASKGATKEMQNKALNNKITSQLNANSAWSAVGLAIKNNKEYQDYLPAFELLEFEEGFLEKLISLIKKNKFNEADKHMINQDLRWKAQAYVMASIIKNGKIPNDWKTVIKGGLFANEKPYLD